MSEVSAAHSFRRLSCPSPWLRQRKDSEGRFSHSKVAAQNSKSTHIQDDILVSNITKAA